MDHGKITKEEVYQPDATEDDEKIDDDELQVMTKQPQDSSVSIVKHIKQNRPY